MSKKIFNIICAIIAIMLVLIIIMWDSSFGEVNTSNIAQEAQATARINMESRGR